MANSRKKLSAESVVEKNYESFQKLLPELMLSDSGRFALLRDGAVVEIFDTSRDALACAKKLFDDDVFSVQQIAIEPINLGYWSSHA